jgi:hypothetical protein
MNRTDIELTCRESGNRTVLLNLGDSLSDAVLYKALYRSLLAVIGDT